MGRMGAFPVCMLLVFLCLCGCCCVFEFVLCFLLFGARVHAVFMC